MAEESQQMITNYVKYIHAKRKRYIFISNELKSILKSKKPTTRGRINELHVAQIQTIRDVVKCKKHLRSLLRVYRVTNFVNQKLN